MVELVMNSNIWYQAYVFKESANEVKVRPASLIHPGGWDEIVQASRPCSLNLIGRFRLDPYPISASRVLRISKKLKPGAGLALLSTAIRSRLALDGTPALSLTNPLIPRSASPVLAGRTPRSSSG